MDKIRFALNHVNCSEFEILEWVELKFYIIITVIIKEFFGNLLGDKGGVLFSILSIDSGNLIT